ncbi:winged helix-turn-helix transcriptional regulator [Barrientosiimonas marina]|uniref:Carbohydrate kinase family protein n=1 Tax=Lentibacillus kimchii TaxID=1542911 RepID=A0ABW2UWG8_9BACI
MKKDPYQESPIICIGGANVDRKFYLKSNMVSETSNPVQSSSSAGGVARNIAENLGRLGEHVKLITASGYDAAWQEIANGSYSFMDLSAAAQFEEQATGSYTAVLDKNGDLAIAFADMEVFDAITPDLLQEKQATLKTAKCIVVDLNCSQDTIDFLCRFAVKEQIPLAIIPVSAPKMANLPAALDAVNWLIINKDETETFMNMMIQNHKDWEHAVQNWLDCGIQNVVITNGAEGAMAGNEHDGVCYYPSIDTPVITDVTGAGDSFCSAVIHAWLQDQSLDTNIQSGMVNAHKTIMSNQTVRTDLSSAQLAADVKRAINAPNH